MEKWKETIKRTIGCLLFLIAGIAIIGWFVYDIINTSKEEYILIGQIILGFAALLFTIFIGVTIKDWYTKRKEQDNNVGFKQILLCIIFLIGLCFVFTLTYFLTGGLSENISYVWGIIITVGIPIILIMRHFVKH